MGNGEYGIDPKMLSKYANDINAIIKKGVEVAVVIGGGNITEESNQKEQVLIGFKEIIWVC